MATLTLNKPMNAEELLRLPAHERDRILESAANPALAEYELNTELTAFEAFGKDDLNAYSSSTRPR